MDTKHSRLSVWALALLTCFALLAPQSAFAMDKQKPRVEGAGWICKPDFSGCGEVKFGITGKLNKSNLADGRFEYMNKINKYNVHGKITSLVVNPNPSASPSHPCMAAVVFVGGTQVSGPPLDAPYAKVSGTCDDGTCTFDATVVDDDSGGHPPDWVCDLHMHGTDKKGNSEVYDDPGQPLQHGHFEVHPENH